LTVARYRWAAARSGANSTDTVPKRRRRPVRRTSEHGAAGAGAQPPPADTAVRIWPPGDGKARQRVKSRAHGVGGEPAGLRRWAGTDGGT